MERKESEHPVKKLLELGASNFEIKDGQPDIIGWKVLNSARQLLGSVSELLFDPEVQKVRYLVLDLSNNVWQIEERQVLIPIGVAELDQPHDFVILPNITAQQISVLPAYIAGNPVISANSELYGHQDFEHPDLTISKPAGSYDEHIPYQVITRIYQEENEAENAFVMLVENGVAERDIKVTPYNPLNSVTDLQGNTNTEFIGDGSRDEYILSIAASSAEQAEMVHHLLDMGV